MGNGASGSLSQRKRAFSKLKHKNTSGDGGFIEMKEFPRSKSKDNINNTAAKYQK